LEHLDRAPELVNARLSETALRSSTFLFRYAGLSLAATIAVVADWSLAAFCWSTWLAGLLFTWLCVISGGLQIVLSARKWRGMLALHLPALERLPESAFTVLIMGTAVILTVLAFQAYSFAFGFYGLFLSFFAEMEPHALFGRNGFINSDFWTPVRYLAGTFWAMSIGTMIAYGSELVRSNPWQRMLLPFASELLRVHMMVVVMPFLALGAWAVLGESYQSVVIVLLMAVFYLLPSRSTQIQKAATADVAQPQRAAP
jgi:hypothetical protein